MDNSSSSRILNIAYMNIHGQSKLTTVKELQIEDFLKYNNIDILHLQEIFIEAESFSKCSFVSSAFNIIPNNCENRYGTATLIRSDLEFENVKCDTAGRAIVFDIGDATFGNIYAQSGTDGHSRSSRENFCGEILPNLLINSKSSGCIGGDFNMIIDKQDASSHQSSKMSPTFQKVVRSFNWTDSYRLLFPNTMQFSRYYGEGRASGATRIDRSYHFGDITIKKAYYLPLAFSDHHAHIVQIKLPNPFSNLICPRTHPAFRIKAEVVIDPTFQANLAEALETWNNVKSFGMEVLPWWELIVKPGIKKLALHRSREMNRRRKEELNLLRLRQNYLNRKLMLGETWRLPDLKAVHTSIQLWYSKEAEKIKYQSLTDEHQSAENVRIYHHELHRKRIRKSAILRLETEGRVLEGHQACAAYLEKTVEDLLLYPAELCQAAQGVLLAEVNPVFSESDNQELLKLPTKAEVFETLQASNLHAAPGTDGLTNFFYKENFKIMGQVLTEVVREVFRGKQPTASQRTSKMVFGSKPKKLNSCKPGDKRRISLLNCDFKTMSGLESRRLKKVSTRTLSPYQLVAGDDRRIHHGINLARDAIQAASKVPNKGCGIADTDYQAAFDFLVMSWVFKVLQKKGLSQEVINRYINLYEDNLSVIIVNNIEGKCLKNIRLSLRQGDVPSMTFFAYGIDPLISYLDKRLTGILITSLPVQGPLLSNSSLEQLAPVEERYRVISYADDLKPAVTSMEEFSLVNSASALFESASGCRLHRDPASLKCKFLPLGKWRTRLQQNDLPADCQYFAVSDHLDMVGVELRATWVQTRKHNGDIIQHRVANTINPWRSGKFMDLTMRPWSVNTYVLSKVWSKCRSVDLREGDINTINSSIKSWLYADLLEKPSEMVMCRPTSYGGLGVCSVRYKAKALLIRSFLETAVIPKYRQSLLHSLMFRYHVLGDTSFPNPGFLPYYPPSFFDTIRRVHESPENNVTTMSIKQWVKLLTEDNLTMEVTENTKQFKLCRVELSSPRTDWTKSWRLCRLNGLGSEISSFNFKLLHQLLVSRVRQHQMMQTVSPECNLCQNNLEDLPHALIHCSFNNGVGERLLDVVKTYIPGISDQALLRLEFDDLPQDLELAVVFFTSFLLMSIWEKRRNRSKPSLYETRATLEAKCSLLRKTRFKDQTPSLETMLSNL